MSWLLSKIYDAFMSRTEDASLREWRRELLSEAHGRVLEIGAGTGANLEFYPDAVTELVATEPDVHMRQVFTQKAPEVHLVDAAAEDLPFDADEFDVVVSTLVLCTVESQEEALAEISRVLKPGGSLLFIEHVESGRDDRRAWQHRLEPIWKWGAGNCHLTRDTEAALIEAGFELEWVRSESMRKALPIIRETIRGRAVAPASLSTGPNANRSAT